MVFETREASDGKVLVIECPERVDSNVAEELRSIMKECTDQGRFLLVVDMGNTEFMDSSGLGALVSRIAVTRSNSGDVRLACVGEPIGKLLALTHLDQIFRCCESVEAAVESFGG
ncbi:MAG: STAS domain-containing protein [Deltaproteobacteria bacterium]|nr:STAS domain-containing protein [Deltaproteobacteria bacterium]